MKDDIIFAFVERIFKAEKLVETYDNPNASEQHKQFALRRLEYAEAAYKAVAGKDFYHDKK